MGTSGRTSWTLGTRVRVHRLSFGSMSGLTGTPQWAAGWGGYEKERVGRGWVQPRLAPWAI